MPAVSLSSPPAKVCRYCSLCACSQPSLQDGLRFSAWIRRYLYTPLYTTKEDSEDTYDNDTPQRKKKKTNKIQRRKHKRRRLRLE